MAETLQDRVRVMLDLACHVAVRRGGPRAHRPAPRRDAGAELGRCPRRRPARYERLLGDWKGEGYAEDVLDKVLR